MSDWFTHWFGAEYLELYPHRDEEEARAAVRLVRETARTTPLRRALDLACGSGRHTRALREWMWTVGFDLSKTLLDVAVQDGPDISYVRGDMRSLPFAGQAFGLVVNLFTSFGYFDTDDQHVRVLTEIARVTRPGGTFVLDYLNAYEVRRALVPSDERVVNGQLVRQERRISPDGRYVEKTIMVEHCDRTYKERVRLFTSDQLQVMLAANGFTVVQQYGDYAGNVWSEMSPRVIIFAERE